MNPLDIGPGDLPPKHWDDEPIEPLATPAQMAYRRATGGWLTTREAEQWAQEQSDAGDHQHLMEDTDVR